MLRFFLNVWAAVGDTHALMEHIMWPQRETNPSLLSSLEV
jgi:hypothetical protein